MNRLRISHVRLMRESEDRVERAVRSEDPCERMIAGRVLETPSLQRTWTAEHFSLLQGVAAQRGPDNQVSALKTSSFKLIHRKGLFEYLRARSLTPDERRRVFGFFHPQRSLTDAVIAEHHEYLRSACSYLCTNHLGIEVIGDGTFEDPFSRYEELFSDYFRAFCDIALSTKPESEIAHLRGLLPYLKHKMARQRLAILALPQSRPTLRQDERQRQATGNTVRIRRPSFDGAV